MLAGRYEEAIKWADRAVGEQPRWVPGLRIKAALCGYLGRTAEAQECVNRILELYPCLTVANIAAYAAKAVVLEVVSVFVEGLRKAGLPEG
jgi:adenylate cyclase